MHGRLSRFSLLLAMHIGDHGYMDQSKVGTTNTELELSQCFYEGSGLDITYGPAKLRQFE